MRATNIWAATTRSVVLTAILSTACTPLEITTGPSSEVDGECTDSFAVRLSAESTEGTAPLTVSFAARIAEHDLDCGDITFRWNWDGIRYTETKYTDVAYTYTHPGTYAVTVTAMTEHRSVTTQAIVIRVFEDFVPNPHRTPLLLTVSTREFDAPTTTFTAASAITAEAILENPYDFEVGCRIGYRWGPNATFRLYDQAIEVARSGTGLVLLMVDYVEFPSGMTIAASSTLNSWRTPTGSTFIPYPGAFTIATFPAFQCWAPVESSPATIVITP